MAVQQTMKSEQTTVLTMAMTMMTITWTINGEQGAYTMNKQQQTIHTNNNQTNKQTNKQWTTQQHTTNKKQTMNNTQ